MLYRIHRYVRVGILVLVLTMPLSQLLHAEPKVFTAVLEETVEIERVYEVHDVRFKIVTTGAADTFLVNGIINGEAGLDAVTGRMMVNIKSLDKAGMSMKAVGYVESSDKEKGIPACTLWQTRMFEESKLCYTAKVDAGGTFKIVLSISDKAQIPVASGQ